MARKRILSTLNTSIAYEAVGLDLAKTDVALAGSVSIFVSRVVFKGAANHGCPSCIGG